MLNKFIAIICVIAIIAIYFPARHARRYQYVEDQYVNSELLVTNSARHDANLKLCNYENVIASNEEVNFQEAVQNHTTVKALKGGEFVPQNCVPLHKTAVLIPFRNRTEQLTIFLSYMHKFLQFQNLHYRIFVIEQMDRLPFNRAKMLNYGAKVAINLGMDCLILHDVDLIPLNTGNVYACARKPRHMSSSIDAFRFNLPYLTLFGGAVSIQTSHFLKVNGMSNMFDGWGAEDDDFYKRLEANGLLPYRFSPRLSKYTMLNHKKEKASQERFQKLKCSVSRHKVDGLNTLENDDVTVKINDLYTHVLV